MNKLLVVQKKSWKFFFSTPIKNKKWSCQNNLFSANGSTRSYWESAVICCLPVIKMQILKDVKKKALTIHIFVLMPKMLQFHYQKKKSDVYHPN